MKSRRSLLVRAARARSLPALVLALVLLPARIAASEEPQPGHVPFGPGELCTFSIDYGPINAGEATLGVEAVTEYYGSRVYHLRTRTRSNRFFSTFYRVRDQAESYMDADHLFSRYYAKQIREGSYRRDIEMHIDQDAGKVYYRDGKEDDVPHGTQDVLSAFYRVRCLDLEPGQEISLPTRGDKRFYDLTVKVHRREEIDTVLGRVSCLVVQPTLKDEGLFKSEGDLLIWITDDERKVPVKMRANVPVGAIEAKLKDYRAPNTVGTGDP